MFDRTTCRAARALLGWSQEQLATRAGISLGTVKNFEGGTRLPIANNLMAMKRVLEAAGAKFVSSDDGGRGVVIGGLRWGPYSAGEGLNFYIPISDLDVVSGDASDLWFLLEDSAFYELIGRLPHDDREAKQIAHEHRMRIKDAIRNRLDQYWKEGNARPRQVTAIDLENANRQR